MKTKVIALFLFIFSFYGISQVVNPVKWSYKTEFVKENTYLLKFTATLDTKWHLYSQHIGEGGPIPTTFKLTKSADFELIGKVEEKSKPETVFDKNFNMEIKMFSHKAEFVQKINVKTPKTFDIKGTVEFMSCNENTCTPPQEIEYSFTIPATTLSDKVVDKKEIVTNTNSTDSVNTTTNSIIYNEETATTDSTLTNNKSDSSMSLWSFFLLAFIAGIAAMLTPCVYPMIPMTVSFFMQGEQKRSKGIVKGLFFGFSIVFIYTLIGIIVSLTKSGADVTSIISTHWIPNLIFFLLFIVFAASFFGMFEIVLPGSISNKLDQQAEKGGLLGAFFMALTLVVVSFSCTGPIVGAILVEAANGLAIKPILGMFGFSLAFAIPFVVFAISPSLMKKLTKSGSWLNAVKVSMAFILLAFSLKYLLSIDTVYHFNIISREVYLSIWIVLFTMLGVYLLGKLKFAHDSDLKHVGVPRLVFAIAAFSFAVYLVPGLFGAPLNSISSMLPAATKSVFQQSSESVKSTSTLCNKPKYSDFLHLPYQLEGYFDLKEGLSCAKQQNKPVLLDIKGHTCANCKKMEAEVWSDESILNSLRNDFVIIALYTDDKYELPESEWIKSTYDGKIKKTIGAQNLDYEIQKFKANTQPLYCVLDVEGNNISQPLGMTDIATFKKFLIDGKDKFYKH